MSTEELAAKLLGTAPVENDPERVHPSDNTHPARVAATLHARERYGCELHQWAGQARNPSPEGAQAHCELYWADTVGSDNATVLIVASKLGGLGWFCVDLELEPLDPEGELPGSAALELPTLALVAARIAAAATDRVVAKVLEGLER